MMRIVLLLIACDSGTQMMSMDLSAGDFPPQDDLGVCPGPTATGNCAPSGQVCDYGAMRCVCVGTYWQCNVAACPDQPTTSGSCSPDGLACNYGLATSYCVDGSWLGCGDLVGDECQDPAVVDGELCCPNRFMQISGAPCACYQGRQCSCVNNHVQCTPCDM